MPRAFAALPTCLALISAVGCAGRAPAVEPPALRAERIGLAIAVAEGHVARGQFDDAARVLDSPLATATDPGSQARLLVMRGRVAAAQAFGDQDSVAEGRRILERARAAAERAGDRASLGAALDARGWLEYAVALLVDHDFDRPRPWLTEALALREALGDRGPIAETLFHLGLTYEQEGKDAEARPRYERALALATAAGDDMTVSYALRHLAGYLERDGKADEALEYHRRCLALRIKTGQVRFAAFAMLAVGDGELAAQREAVAVAYYRQALGLAEAQANLPAIAASRVKLAGVDERAGRAAEALAHYQAAAELARTIGDAAMLAEIDASIARIGAR
jgi:tetratricopeptide (TPR) repeat protein